jgi:hypothetical protein
MYLVMVAGHDVWGKAETLARSLRITAPVKACQGFALTAGLLMQNTSIFFGRSAGGGGDSNTLERGSHPCRFGAGVFRELCVFIGVTAGPSFERITSNKLAFIYYVFKFSLLSDTVVRLKETLHGPPFNAESFMFNWLSTLPPRRLSAGERDSSQKD